MGKKHASYFNDDGGVPLVTLAFVATAVCLILIFVSCNDIYQYNGTSDTRYYVVSMNGRPVLAKKTSTSRKLNISLLTWGF